MFKTIPGSLGFPKNQVLGIPLMPALDKHTATNLGCWYPGKLPRPLHNEEEGQLCLPTSNSDCAVFPLFPHHNGLFWFSNSSLPFQRTEQKWGAHLQIKLFLVTTTTKEKEKRKKRKKLLTTVNKLRKRKRSLNCTFAWTSATLFSHRNQPAESSCYLCYLAEGRNRRFHL